MAHICFLGLGSNLNQPHLQVQQAIRLLQEQKKVSLQATSRRYRTKPMGQVAQPDYVNAVVKISTSLSPLQLLALCQDIENQMLRVRTAVWGPRTMDIDILLFESQQIDLPTLRIPHPGLLERDFVLVPLKEIAADLILPTGQTLDLALCNCQQTIIEVIESA